MRARSLKLWLVAASMAILMPCGVNAAGLGQLTVRSGLGQPLNAEIELVAVKRGETITARLAPPEVYQPSERATQSGARRNAHHRREARQRRALSKGVHAASDPGAVHRAHRRAQFRKRARYASIIRPTFSSIRPDMGAAPGKFRRGPRRRLNRPRAQPNRRASRHPSPAAPVASAAPPKEAAVRPPSAAPSRATPAPGAAPGQYGPVKPEKRWRGIACNGETRGRHRRETLVALHRQNPDAFNGRT